MSLKNIPGIGWETILKVLIAVILLYLLFSIKELIVFFIFALVIAVLFNFVIDFLEKKGLPRLLGAIFVYFAVFSLLGLFVYLTAPVFFSQIKQFIDNLPSYLKIISPFFEKLGVEIFKSKAFLVQSLQNNLSQAGENIFSALFTLFGGAFSTLFIIFLAFFISLEKNLIERVIVVFSPEEYKEYFNVLWRKSKSKVSGWFISKVVGVIFVGVLTYIILAVLKVKYAPLLGLLAGIADFIPVIGPFFAGLLMAIIISFNSFLQAIFVLISFFIIQGLENNILMPFLFKKLTGLPPILVLISIAVGGKLWGVWGAILVVPLAGVLFEILKDYLIKRQEKTIV